jgi:hypothetical protein
MSIYKFLYEDIRTVTNNNFTLSITLRNKFYEAGYLNFYEIITTPTEQLKKNAHITDANVNQLNKKLSHVYLSLGMSKEIFDWVIKYYYTEYYNALIPKLHLKQIHRAVYNQTLPLLTAKKILAKIPGSLEYFNATGKFR